MKRFFALIALSCALPISVFALVVDVPTQPDSGVVWDQANLLSSETEAQINQMAADLEAKNSSEIGVATVDNLQGTTIEDFALQLARTWGIGQEGTDNGLLLLVAPNEREVRIEVGYGLEGAIPDATASLIIENVLVPAFQNQDYEGGILQATTALTTLAAGEPFEIPGPQYTWTQWVGSFLFVIWWSIVIFSQSRSWWLGGIFGFFIGLLFSPIFTTEVTKMFSIAVIGGFAGFQLDFWVSYYLLGKFPVGDGTGGGSSGSSWGGGSGGFGGGSFGGGGASGRW